MYLDTKSRFSIGATVVAVLLSTLVHAEATDPVPLKPWPAPLYFDLPQVDDAQANAKSGGERLASDPVGSLVFVAVTPCRVVDTRPASPLTGPYGPPSITGTTSRSV